MAVRGTRIESSSPQPSSLPIITPSSYTEDHILSLERLEHVRMRPTAYIPSRGHQGLFHTAGEVIVNGMDEISLMPNGVGKLTIMLCVDTENLTYQLVIQDNGRGIPIGRLLDSYTKLNTSGKYDTRAYETSGGLYGVGAKVAAGTSTHFLAITHRPEGRAALRVKQGIVTCNKKGSEIEIVSTPSAQTGVIVAYEPDPEIFTEVEDIKTFSVFGQDKIITMLQKYCFFRPLNLEFRVHHLGLPPNIWSLPLKEIEVILNRYFHESSVVFSEPTFSRTEWLRSHYWDLRRPFAFQHVIKDEFKSTILTRERVEQETTVRYEAQLYYVKFDQDGGRFGMLNNLPIDDAKSTHLLTVIDAIKDNMANMIKDPSIRKYFLETYKLPIYLAVDMKCPGAEPSGTTKDAFFSASLRRGYIVSLRHKLNDKSGEAFISALYTELAADIEDSYNRNVVGIVKVKNTHRMFEGLNFKDKFTDCDSSDRLDTELFLVEGKSAGGGTEGRNKNLQGQYLLNGKPFNGITFKEAMRASAEDILKNKIYQDIFKIMGINPAKFDPASMYFKRLFVMTDADKD